MYAPYFGLSEPPFSITPDPRFLYLSQAHREALAHLLYGIGEGGGFVQLTGEVGTGKTTLCRCLLEQLPPKVNVALILNPRLTDIELLAAACDELRIAYPADTSSRKVLVDLLHHHLLEAHARGERTALIIDEAQDLAPEVLEEVRLLTNLETPTQKLLQIILIGQPELIRLLDREDLRQLAQRVTARYHLVPFDLADTRTYIRHRLEVAGEKDDVFTEAAIREVHRAASGIPRLINSICDRALLGAFTEDRKEVSAAIARRAAAEVLGRPVQSRWGRLWPWLGATAVVGVLVAGSVLFTYGQMGLGAKTARTDPPATRPSGQDGQATVSAAPSLAAPPPAAMNAPAAPPAPAGQLGKLLSDPSVRGDKLAAFRSLYARWNLDFEPSKHGLGCERGRAEGLHCLFKTGSWAKLRRFDLPVIIELASAAGERRYATVVALDEHEATLDFGGQRHTFPLAEIDRYWDGPFILVWRSPGLSSLPIVPGTRGKDVEWLRQRMSEADGVAASGRSRDIFDDELKARVIAFQRAKSLVADGVVGEETVARLAPARDGRTPRILSDGS